MVFEAGEQFAQQPAVWWVEQGPHDPLVVADDNFMLRYDIEPTTVDGLAGQTARRVATLGEPAIQIHGDGNQVVSKIGVGTGCCTTPAVFQDLGCDLSIVTDDGTWYWAQLQRAADEGHPFIRVHHGTSEEPGMATLAQYLNANLPGVRADHLPHRPIYRTLTASPVAPR
ncbi:MAG TPA: hypothetical protein DGT23_05835 [Micromonosporaceae bacterium]|nr:hypothetical protein [Micromonosporaceae bacterium]